MSLLCCLSFVWRVCVCILSACFVSGLCVCARLVCWLPLHLRWLSFRLYCTVGTGVGGCISRRMPSDCFSVAILASPLRVVLCLRTA